jgi:signal transduction histidine kinase
VPSSLVPDKLNQAAFVFYEVSLLKVSEPSDEHPFLLAALPPSKGQIRAALGVVAALLVAFGVVAPFTNIKLPRLFTIEDSGTGIDRNDKDRIFEPFFTTKSS